MGTADLQAWGIVQNQSGEDWKGVKLSLVAGAPLAFQATLEKPVVPPRPIVTDQGEVIASVPTGETSLSDVPPPAASPAPTPDATMPPMAKAEEGRRHTLDELEAADKDSDGAGDDQDRRVAAAGRSKNKPKAASSASAGPKKEAKKGDVASRFASSTPMGRAGGVPG